MIKAYPKIDGHFWVVRDGKIIDPDFPGYCTGSNERFCLDAPLATQLVMIGVYHRITKQLPNSHIKHVLSLEPEEGRCYWNAMGEIIKNGGELRFGSMGYRSKSGETWFDYGGAHYKTYVDFLAKY